MKLNYFSNFMLKYLPDYFSKDMLNNQEDYLSTLKKGRVLDLGSVEIYFDNKKQKLNYKLFTE